MSKNCIMKEQSRSPRIPIQEGGEGCLTKRRRVAVGRSVLPQHEEISRVPGSCVKVGTWERERTAPRCTREVPVDQRGAEPINARAEVAAASGAASPAAWRAEWSSPMPSTVAAPPWAAGAPARAPLTPPWRAAATATEGPLSAGGEVVAGPAAGRLLVCLRLLLRLSARVESAAAGITRFPLAPSSGAGAGTG